jgi:hypothetical protein
MPTRRATRKAKRDLAQGKKPSTAAGEFIREEMDQMKRRSGRRPRSREQAIAIGLSEARRAGIPVKPRPRRAKQRTRRAAGT